MLTASGIHTTFDDPATSLAQVTFVVLDLETTGTGPDTCAITEVGALKYRGGECLGTFDTLVNPGVPIPPFITVLTGISEAMVLPAPPIDEVLPALLEFIGPAVIVGHNLRFDTSFIDAALRRRGGLTLDHPRVDTLAIARRLLDDEVPDHRLGTLAHHLNVPTDPCHRALADARATAEVLHALLARAASWGVLGLDDLLTLPTMRKHPSTNKLKLTARLPRRPGVYRFRDRTGTVLYVGKAANLRTRVRSHFGTHRRRAVPQLLRETHSIDWIECTDELESSVREARLIAEHEPRFNHQGRGWRAYAYVKVTLNERLPRVSVVRTVRDDGAHYFGPLRSTAAAQAVRDAIEAAVPLRRCGTRIARTTDLSLARPCDATSVDGGPCPCREITSDADYAERVTRVVRGLRGEPAQLLDPLAKRMHDLVAVDRFEAAAATRDQVTALSRALNRHQSLTRLCSSGTIRMLTDAGIIELDNGVLHLEGDPAPASTHRTNAAVIDRRHLDELLVVASWIDREVGAGRARVLTAADRASSPAAGDPASYEGTSRLGIRRTF